jgi:dihydroorotase-like cyclic amidohydrolase
VPSRRWTDHGVVAQTRGETVSEEQLEEMGPLDYVVLEWPGELPTAGEVQPLLLDLVDRGIIRILDIAFLTKGEDGSVSALEVGDLKQVAAAFAAFEGASSGLLGYEDLQEAAAALDPGTSAVVLVWENRWAAPVAAALRRSGGQLVASGRLPIQAILAALDEVEATN